MKKFIFVLGLAVVLVFSVTTTYAEPVWEDISDGNTKYRYNDCLVGQMVEDDTIFFLLQYGNHTVKDMTVLTKDYGVLKLESFHYVTEPPTGILSEKKEDSFFSVCGEVVRFLPPEIKERIQSYWDLYK